jgi:hypothetical protein
MVKQPAGTACRRHGAAANLPALRLKIRIPADFEPAILQRGNAVKWLPKALFHRHPWRLKQSASVRILILPFSA